MSVPEDGYHGREFRTYSNAVSPANRLPSKECKLPDQVFKHSAENKKPAGLESAAGFPVIWCPGEDSNLHSVATART